MHMSLEFILELRIYIMCFTFESKASCDNIKQTPLLHTKNLEPLFINIFVKRKIENHVVDLGFTQCPSFV